MCEVVIFVVGFNVNNLVWLEKDLKATFKCCIRTLQIDVFDLSIGVIGFMILCEMIEHTLTLLLGLDRMYWLCVFGTKQVIGLELIGLMFTSSSSIIGEWGGRK